MPRKKAIEITHIEDLFHVPREGETEVDMHNRMTEQFIKDNTQKPTIKSVEKKQGGGFFGADIGLDSE